MTTILCIIIHFMKSYSPRTFVLQGGLLSIGRKLLLLASPLGSANLIYCYCYYPKDLYKNITITGGFWGREKGFPTANLTLFSVSNYMSLLIVVVSSNYLCCKMTNDCQVLWVGNFRGRNLKLGICTHLMWFKDSQLEGFQGRRINVG